MFKQFLLTNSQITDSYYMVKHPVTPKSPLPLSHCYRLVPLYYTIFANLSQTVTLFDFPPVWLPTSPTPTRPTPHQSDSPPVQLPTSPTPHRF